MIEHLMRLSLHQQLRRGHGYNPERGTIDGATAGRLLEMGWAEQWELGGTSHSPPARWVSLSPLGRKVIDRYLRLKL